MSETKKADTQRLMQLIVKSSKVTTLAMQSVKSALAGDISSARGLLDEAYELKELKRIMFKQK